jgi:SAM-dependent methyltransferase
MRRAYDAAYDAIAQCVGRGASLLDCGASDGSVFDVLAGRCGIAREQYQGIEWHAPSAAAGRARGLNIVQGDLNKGLPQQEGSFSCVYALSVLEHLLNPCRFLAHCHRVLRPGGRLVLLTPNISTYFTAALILSGRMPSSGPHPDSNALLQREELFKVSSEELQHDAEDDTPVHRHLIVFSYRVLRDYLRIVGFSRVEGRGFGLYPFPVFMQRLLGRLDPWHCHQMVFVATK